MGYFILGFISGLVLGYKHEITFSVKKYSGAQTIEEITEDNEE